MKGMTARETAQRSDIFCIEILQQIFVDDRFDRARRCWRASWCGPAVDQDVQATQLLCRIGDHAVHLLLAGDVGWQRNDAPVRRGSQFRRRRLQIPLLRATIATSTPSRANSRAMALPMPRLPPVTIACLSLQSEGPWHSLYLGKRDQILLPHCSLFSLRNLAQGCCQTQEMLGRPTCLRHSRRRSTIQSKANRCAHP